MYRVMLADDEGIVLDSLKMIIEKQFPGECQIETAKTGRSVIELAESFRPNIAFMDIQMPGINGIDAMKEIMQSNPSIVFIVLTAYDRFEYAKEAINLGVFEYLNKPFSPAMIEDVLKRAFKLVDSRKKKRSDDLIIKEKLERVTPIIENGFVYASMFREQFEDELSIYKQVLGISADYGYMLAVMVEDNKHGEKEAHTDGVGIWNQVNYDKIISIIKNTWPCLVGLVITNKIPVFIPKEEDKIEYEERIAIIDMARELTRQLRKKIGLNFRIGIGSVKKIRESRDSYEEAVRALNNSSSSVAHVEDMDLQLKYDEEYPLDLEKTLFATMRAGKKEECARAADAYFDWMVQTYDDDNISVKLKILEFVLFADHEVYLKGGVTYHFEDRADYLPIVMNASGNSALRSWFVKKFRNVAEKMVEKKGEKENHLIVQAKVYISENFQKDISLDDVSRRLDLSSYYFSKLFKEETGSNFTEYVTKLRMDKAKELLEDKSLSMKAICSAVGYSDPNYFSRIFKKNEGVTPTEYRGREVHEI